MRKLYKIIKDDGTSRQPIATYDSFVSAQSGLHHFFNQNMWSGYVCSWTSSVSYMGNINGVNTKTYIKKYEQA